MNLKEEYKSLVGNIQYLYQAKTGKKLTIEAFAQSVGLNRVTVQKLLGEEGKVREAHLNTAKERYKDILQNATIERTNNNKGDQSEKLIESLEYTISLLEEKNKTLMEKVFARMDQFELNLKEMEERNIAAVAIVQVCRDQGNSILAHLENKKPEEIQRFYRKRLDEYLTSTLKAGR